ncbi:MAG: dUTP diphosphatase [Candidatus Krumholzibacteria bacterium]|nr:dUTP diphosphatase [Candidatus Krumholzibacteria bacterium]
MKVSIRYLAHHEGLPLLGRMTDGASGYDIRAACDEDIIIEPGETILVPSGIEISIPPGYEGQVRPRSGLALKNSVGVLNSPGTIDSDYRGELGVILTNFGKEVFPVSRGDRIAQIIFVELPHVELVEMETLDATGRGDGGYGSTGKG